MAFACEPVSHECDECDTKSQLSRTALAAGGAILPRAYRKATATCSTRNPHLSTPLLATWQELCPRLSAMVSSHERSLKASLAALTKQASSAECKEILKFSQKTYHPLLIEHYLLGVHLQNLRGETICGEYETVPAQSAALRVSSTITQRTAQAKRPKMLCRSGSSHGHKSQASQTSSH